MWEDMDICASNEMPRFLTVVAGFITLSPILKKTTDDGSFWTPWEVPAMKNSVFVGLSFNMFVDIQSLKSVMQCSSWRSAARHAPGDLGLNEPYIWVSSAYTWNLSPCLRMMFPTEEVYKMKPKGPNTEPCGTPYSKSYVSEKLPSIWTW